LFVRDGANTQYATGTSFLVSVYSDLLSRYKQYLQCGDQTYEPSILIAFAKQQVHIHIIIFQVLQNI